MTTTNKMTPKGHVIKRQRAHELLDELLDVVLADDGGRPEHYSTETPDRWPPRARSRRHARELIRRVPGHERVGLGRETQWRVDAAAYDAQFRRRSVAKAVPSAPLADDEAIADEALSGWRKTSGGAP